MTDRDGVDVVLLAGGINSRLEALSGTIYKPFLPLRAGSLIVRHISRSAFGGAQRLLVITDEPDPVVDQLVEEAAAAWRPACAISLLVCAGSPAEKILSGVEQLDVDERVVVLLADSFSRYSCAELVRSAREPGADSAMTVADFRLPFGVIDEHDGRVTAFREKPAGDYLVNAGQLALGPKALAHLAAHGDVAATLVELAATGVLASVRVSGEFVTVDSLDDIARAWDVDFEIDPSPTPPGTPHEREPSRSAH